MSQSFLLTSAYANFSADRKVLDCSPSPSPQCQQFVVAIECLLQISFYIQTDLFVEVYVDQKLVQKSKVLKKDIEPKWDEIITM